MYRVFGFISCPARNHFRYVWDEISLKSRLSLLENIIAQSLTDENISLKLLLTNYLENNKHILVLMTKFDALNGHNSRRFFSRRYIFERQNCQK